MAKSGVVVGVTNAPLYLRQQQHKSGLFWSREVKLSSVWSKPLNIRTTNLSFLPQIKAHIAPPNANANANANDYFPDSKFYKVEAILRPWRVQKVSSALLKLGIRGVTVSDVRGFGAQGGSAERHAGSEFSEDSFVSKVKMEIVVSKDQVDPVIDLIIQEARTGEIGDGKIFVLPVADIIRIRTGERAEEAERMSGGRYDILNSIAGSPP